MAKVQPTKFKATIFSAKMQDGEWSFVLKIPASFGVQAAAMAVNHEMVWDIEARPELRKDDVSM